jgi:hypothetical protein
MGNPKAFEGLREGTQFKASGNEPLIAKIDLKLTQTMKNQLKAIPEWQTKLRNAIAQLIESEEEC